MTLSPLRASHALTLGLAVSNLCSAQQSSSTGALPPAAARTPSGWHLQDSLGLPGWLRISGSQRTRFEVLDGQFRSAATLDENDHLFALRTTLRADVRLERFLATAELMDSRQYEADRGSVVDTTIVNAAELVQAFVGYESRNAWTEGDKSTLILGRHTLDLGSRRLVARNDFRNTTNTFDGLNWHWEDSSRNSLHAFFTLPVRRLPGDQASLLDNDPELDESDTHVQFWGLYGTLAELVPGVQGEAYWLHLKEQDTAGIATANRNLTTTGGRLLKKPAKSQFDFELESAYQFGQSRASSTSSAELDHLAFFHHAEGGYTFDAAWKPRLALQFDYASGDASGTDGENNRFDTLFGARRWEFGPTGIFGALARSNLVSPGWRVTALPKDGVDLMFAHRLAYLASATDSYVPGGVRDATGNSGDEIGQLAELRVRWMIVPGNLSLDLGVAHLFAGEFLDNAPNASGNGDTNYAYIQTILSF